MGRGTIIRVQWLVKKVTAKKSISYPFLFVDILVMSAFRYARFTGPPSNPGSLDEPVFPGILSKNPAPSVPAENTDSLKIKS